LVKDDYENIPKAKHCGVLFQKNKKRYIYYSMIISLEGNQREGKSLGMTALGIYFAKKYGNIPLIANYHIFNYDNFIYFEKPRELAQLNNCIILYDEIGTTADARSWGSKEQVLFSHVFAQMGKRGNTFIYTAQRDYLVEKRVRQQTDIVIECQKDYGSKVLYQTWYNTQRGRDRATLIGRYKIRAPERVYDAYDTFEVIQSHVNFDDIIGKWVKNYD